MLKNSFTHAENDDGSGVRYVTGVKSPGLRAQLEASRVSSKTEELWYSVDDDIYVDFLLIWWEKNKYFWINGFTNEFELFLLANKQILSVCFGLMAYQPLLVI